MVLLVCRDHVCLDDLEQLLPKERAAKALKVLDVDGDGKVSLHDMRDAVIQIYNERKNLAFTLKDTWTVVGKLEFVIGISIHLLFGFFYLLIFEVSRSPFSQMHMQYVCHQHQHMPALQLRALAMFEVCCCQLHGSTYHHLFRQQKL